MFDVPLTQHCFATVLDQSVVGSQQRRNPTDFEHFCVIDTVRMKKYSLIRNLLDLLSLPKLKKRAGKVVEQPRQWAFSGLHHPVPQHHTSATPVPLSRRTDMKRQDQTRTTAPHHPHVPSPRQPPSTFIPTPPTSIRARTHSTHAQHSTQQ